MPPLPPLPPRGGLHAVWVRTPDRSTQGQFDTFGDFLRERLKVDAPVDDMLAAGEFVFNDATPLSGDEPFRPSTFVWFHRRLADEPARDWDLNVLHTDERLVVLDKPSGLATIPRGTHVTQSAVVQLRLALDMPDLSPAHRLDRLTAGVLVFTTQRQWRGAYQEVFEQRRANKVYEAIAPIREGLELPRTVRSHIVKQRGNLQAVELPDEPPNSETLVELVETRGDFGRYRLIPRTGKTHQLRVHMSGLGIPIVGDPLYPTAPTDEEALDGDLQLVARELTFTDPVDGTERRFTSQRPLTWPGKARRLDAAVLDPPTRPSRGEPAAHMRDVGGLLGERWGT